jgi:DNA-binding transcriptional LysR family regulator
MDAHLRDLRYFVTVAEELHFTRAAELLHISQPSLSKQIRLLEQGLGFQLLRRDRRTVALTNAGELLLPRVRELLAAWDEAVAEAARLARDAASVMRVGFHTSVAGGLYGNAVAAFGDRRPDWTVELRLHPWSDATAGLADASSDVAFLWLPGPNRERIHCRVLRSEARCVALWQGHRLASAPEVRIGDLLDEPFVALPPSAGVLRDYWLAVEHRNGHPVRIGTHAESPDATFEAVAAKQGVVLLAEGNAELYSRPGIVSRTVVDLTPAELAIAWRANDDRSIIDEFVKAATAAVATSPLPRDNVS